MLATAAIVLVAFGVFNMIGSHQTEQPATGYAVMQPGSPSKSRRRQSSPIVGWLHRRLREGHGQIHRSVIGIGRAYR